MGFMTPREIVLNWSGFDLMDVVGLDPVGHGQRTKAQAYEFKNLAWNSDGLLKF